MLLNRSSIPIQIPWPDNASSRQSQRKFYVQDEWQNIYVPFG